MSLSRTNRSGCVHGLGHAGAASIGCLSVSYIRMQINQDNTTRPRKSMRPIIASSRHGSHDVPHGSAVARVALVIDEERLPIKPVYRP